MIRMSNKNTKSNGIPKIIKIDTDYTDGKEEEEAISDLIETDRDGNFLIDIETGAVPIPKNIFKKSNGHVFKDALEEQHCWEQFFWTKDVVEKIANACEYNFVEETCCMMTPSLAHQFHEQGRDETLLDIDTRFAYLPKFRYYDVTNPKVIDDTFRLLVLDPPFFLIPIEMVRKAVDVITKKDYNTRIMIAFLKRAEARLRKAFKEYDLVPTHFKLEYASIKPDKWGNFVLYSNIDLPGIKRIKET
jgi:hypothetical protein